jgi:DNA-binding transcriptional LysR family regulator
MALDVFLARRSPAFTLQNLRYAVVAADFGSFRRAAEALAVRQSTLSRCVRQLEESVDIALFNRSSGGVHATKPGREFLRGARSILEQLEVLAATAQSTGRGEAGKLAIAFYTSLAAGNFRATLVEVARRFPQIELEMLETSRAHVATALRNGAVDIAIIPGAAALPDTRSMGLWSERMLVAVPEGHALADHESVYWTDLRGQKILLTERDPGPELQDLLMAKAASPGERPNVVRHDVSRASITSLVGAGFGITLATEASAGTNVAGAVYRELRDGAEPARVGYSAHWRGDNENPALATFLKVLGERYPLPSFDS